MTELKMDWGMECPKCNHNEAMIHSTAEKDSEYEFMDGEAVTCLKCGNTGEISAEGEDSDVVWNEDDKVTPPLEMKQLLATMVSRQDMPYVIIMNAENFRILSTQCNIGSALLWLPNYKTVYGIQIHIDENHPLKAVTKQEFQDLYKTS